jgi:branched-subunit amino acid ABC-type transport system permease component/ABC-type branched-subunit amino acid transport system ATPase component
VKEFLQLAIAGAATGAIYSLMAAGLTLSYTATGIFNLAYGAIAFCAALLYYELNTGLGWSIVPAFVVVVLVFCPLLGLLLNVAVFRPLARATDEAKIMATVGLLIALPALARFIIEVGITRFGWGIPDAKQVTLPPGIWRSPPSVSRLPFGVILDSNRIAVLVTAAVVAVGLWALMRHTPLGLRMRAVVDRPDLAALRGVDERRTSAAAWVIGTTLAGLAGVVGAPVINSLQEASFNLVMFIAAAAVVLGGMRSIPLAFAGGLLIGVLESLVRRYATFASDINGFNNAVPFVLLLVGLVLLARDRGRRGGSVVAQPPPVDWTDDLPVWRRRLPWIVAVALFFLWTFVFLRDSQYWLGNFATGLAFGVVFLSFVIVTGQGGMVSLAQAAFVMIASLTAGRVLSEHGLPWGVALVVGTLVAVVLGVIVALPALRLGGLPLALATLALGFIGDRVLFKWDWLRNYQSGWRIRRPVIGPFDLSDRTSMIVFLALVIAALTWMIHNLGRSASGRSITAVRNSEPAAVTSGLSIPRTKLAVFAVSAGVAGFGGILVATNNGSAAEGTFVTQTGLAWLAAVVLFGIRRPQGAIIAGLVTACSTPIFTGGFHPAFLPTFLHWDGLSSSIATNVSNVLFGLGAIQLAREPDGILAITARQNRQRRDRRRARTSAAAPQEAPAAPTPVVAAVTVAPGVTEVPAALGRDDVALELVGVTSGYGPVEVLRGVSLTVRPGRITAVLGPNGAGKSTLCATIAGLVPTTSGAIVHRGVDITAVRTPRRATAGSGGIVLAPEARGVFPQLTVRENLSVWLPEAGDRDAAFERFPVLRARQNLPAGSLSGGEQQMLTLAPLLVRPPDVLIADEPSLGLAPLIVEEILTVFTELRDRGVALVLVEEKAKGVLDIADEVSFLSLGHLVWSGERAAVDDDLLRRVYLGAPTGAPTDDRPDTAGAPAPAGTPVPGPSEPTTERGMS